MIHKQILAAYRPFFPICYRTSYYIAVPEELSRTFLVGTPDEVAAQMQVYIDLGIRHFMLWFMDAPERGGLRLFAEEVMPRFRGEEG